MTVNLMNLSRQLAIAAENLKSHAEDQEAVGYLGVKRYHEWLVDFLKDEMDQAESLYKYHLNDSLTISAVEAEGYLRACKTIANHIEVFSKEYLPPEF